MGHVSKDTGNRVYNHKTLDELKAAVEMINIFWNPLTYTPIECIILTEGHPMSANSERGYENENRLSEWID